MRPRRSLVELLRDRAAAQPDRPAYAFLEDGETAGPWLTYARLDAAARANAAALQARGVARGDRVLLLYPPGLDFIAGFFGALYAGAVAIPCYPPHPARAERALPRLLGIMADADARATLCPLATGAALTALTGGAARPALPQWIASDRVPAAAADAWSDPGVGPDDLALLQYTSGSTAAPRGVMVSHGNLLHNLAYLRAMEAPGEAAASVSWLPTNHDMGLIEGVLQPTFSGYPAYLMAPVSFLQRPLRWLQAISRYRATTSGGPNFAYDLCVRKIRAAEPETLDLSCWEVAFNGAEPIRRDTLVAFHEAFRGCGFRWRAFYPVYGLAEATLLVSSRRRSDEPLVATVDREALARGKAISVETDGGSDAGGVPLVGCGATRHGTHAEIVDPESHTRCAPGVIGEVWLSGPGIARGYWRRPEESERTFGARLGGSGDGPFLRTGDLGFMLDGGLFISGRLKDLLIVRGAKHFPQDLEATAERSHPAVAPGRSAAFSCDAGAAEQPVLAVELDPRSLRRGNGTRLLAEVVNAVRDAVADVHGVRLHGVALVAHGGLPRTTSGKLRRGACRQAFVDGALAEFARWSLAGGLTLQVQPAVAERRAGATPGATPAAVATPAAALLERAG